MVTVLSIGPKDRGFQPGRGRWIFKDGKNPQHVFFRREIKLSRACRKILHVKEPGGELHAQHG
jgi:hypothetical protein